MDGGIQHANKIGKNVGVGRNRHVRVTLRSIEDKSKILRNRGLLKGTCIYLDQDLTFTQQEEKRKEWEKIKSTRERGNWAWLKNGKAQVTDRLTNKK